MSDDLIRFASGEIKNCKLKNKNSVGKYGFYFTGYFEDTKDKIEGYYGQPYPIRVYEGSNDPVDPETAENLRFHGRVMFKQSEYNGKDYYWPKAISIEKRIEAYDPSEYSEDYDNPFIKNPITK